MHLRKGMASMSAGCRRAGMLTLVVATALATGSATAQAAVTPPSWHVYQVFGADSGNPGLEGVAATGASDAWVSGTTAQALVIEHWAGVSWQAQSVPSNMTVGGSDSVVAGPVGAASARDMWSFPSIITTSADIHYALHWNGTNWKEYKLSGTLGIFGTAVFSASDAWAFGQAPVHKVLVGYGPPYAARFNGRAWNRVAMPGVPVNVSPLAPNDIWAMGPTAKTANDVQTKQAIIAMRWDGSRWHSMSVPRVRLSKNGKLAAAYDFVALGRRDLWVAEGLPEPACGCMLPAPGIALLHWNGRSWRHFILSRSLIAPMAMTSDGRGGLWFEGLTITAQDRLLHYLAGKFIETAVPTIKDFNSTFNSMALIPGTHSLWGTGILTPVPNGTSEGAIYKYGP